MSKTIVKERTDEMTLAELKVRASELGIKNSDVDPIEATGETPVKADWLRTVLQAERAAVGLKEEWCAAGSELIHLFEATGTWEKAQTGVRLASKLADGTATNVDLFELREAVNLVAAFLRHLDERDLAARFSQANYTVRRAERATRPMES